MSLRDVCSVPLASDCCRESEPKEYPACSVVWCFHWWYGLWDCSIRTVSDTVVLSCGDGYLLTVRTRCVQARRPRRFERRSTSSTTSPPRRRRRCGRRTGGARRHEPSPPLVATSSLSTRLAWCSLTSPTTHTPLLLPRCCDSNVDVERGCWPQCIFSSFSLLELCFRCGGAYSSPHSTPPN